MTTQWIKPAALAIACAFAVTACNKYEDGPLVSPQSKKARVANTWVIEQAMDDGQDVTDSFDQYELYLTKDGDATLSAEYSWADFTLQTDTDGTWEFANNKEDLVLDFEDDDADESYQILRLTGNELWLREKGEDLELHLATK